MPPILLGGVPSVEHAQNHGTSPYFIDFHRQMIYKWIIMKYGDAMK